MQRLIALRPTAFSLSLIAWAILAAVALAGPLSAIDRPFPGFWVEHSGHIGATDLADWTGPRAGLRQLDRIVAVEGRPFADPKALARLAAAAPVGTLLHYRLADGRELAVPTMRLSLLDVAKSGLTWWVAAVVHLALGAWVVHRRPHLASARAHWRYCQAFALFLLGGSLGMLDPDLTPVNYVGCALMLPAIAHLAIAFPVAAPQRAATAVRRVVGGLTAILLALVALAYAWSPAFGVMFDAVLLLPGLALLATLAGWAWVTVSRAFTPRVRAQALIALVGLGVSLLPSLVYSAAGAMGVVLPGFEFAFVGFCAFPAAIAYAIVRHQAFDLDRMVRRAMLYALLTAGLGALYAGAVAAGHWAFAHWASEARRAGVAGFMGAVAVAVALRPLEAWLRRRLDGLFLGRRADPIRAAAELGAHAVGSANAAVPTLACELAALIKEVLGAEWVALSLDGAVIGHGGSPGDRPALEVGLSGVSADRLLVGPRASGMPFTSQDAVLAEMLGAQAVLGLDRTALFEERLRLEVRHAEASARAEEREALFLQVVHDVGTDLSNIAVATDLARQLPGDEGPLASIEASLGRIERFLSEKRRSLQAAGQARSSRLEAGLELAIATVTPGVAHRSQRLRWRSSVPTVAVPLSEVELAQVIGNVLANAVKFSPVGAEIAISASLEGPAVRVVVEDAGPGIAPGLLDMLGTGRRAGPDAEGTGLGLANAMALLRPVGGALSWRNGEAGAIVEVILPRVG